MSTAALYDNDLILVPIYMIAAGLLSLVFTGVCVRILPLFGMLDVPHGRHQHDHPVPRGGGIAIILAWVFTTAIALYHSGGTGLGPKEYRLFIQLGPPTLLITILGILDDKFELRSIVKLFAQLVIAVYFCFTGAGIHNILGYMLPIWLTIPITICWVIGIINAFNLIDGMDGVAAGLAAIASFSMSVWILLTDGSLLIVICMLTFCGACLGFLRYNFSPAKIFMGDTGSLFIGLFFSYFSMAESAKAATLTSLLVPILAMGVPIFDVFLAIMRRLFRKYVKKEPGVGIMTGDHDHLHHRIQDSVQDKKKTAYYLYFLASILVAGAIFAASVSDLLQTLSFAVLLCIIFVVVRFATIEFYDVASMISDGIHIPHRSFLLTAIHPAVDMFLLVAAYVLTSILFQRNITFSPFTLKQALCYIAPFPVILVLSGIYRTYWLRPGIARYYRLLLTLVLAAVIVLALALGFILLEFGKDRDQISLMREFFTTYAFMGISFIFLERFSLHYLESFYYSQLRRLANTKGTHFSRTVIYGGGLFCKMFLVAENSVSNEFPTRTLIGIVDDNPYLRGLNVYGMNVLGTSHDLRRLKRKYDFDEIVIALRNIPEETRQRIHDFGRKNGIRVVEFRYEIK